MAGGEAGGLTGGAGIAGAVPSDAGAAGALLGVVGAIGRAAFGLPTSETGALGVLGMEADGAAWAAEVLTWLDAVGAPALPVAAAAEATCDVRGPSAAAAVADAPMAARAMKIEQTLRQRSTTYPEVRDDIPE